jgi:uncharacterized protein
MPRLLILADSHVPDFAAELPSWVLRIASQADRVIHAGDVTTARVLDQLAACAPVVAILGNGDCDEVRAWGATIATTLEVEGVTIAAVHDAGRRAGRDSRLRRRFPAANVAVFGHSHIPELRLVDGLWMVNPGSPTWKRRQRAPTVVVADVADGAFRPRLVEGG